MFIIFFCTQGKISAQIWNGSTNIATTNRQGRVLIGSNTINPIAKLHLFSSLNSANTESTLRIERVFPLFESNTAPSSWDIALLSNNIQNLDFTFNPQIGQIGVTPPVLFSMTPSGNFGINTTTPTQ
jgi:hypothetical protein